MSLSLFHKNPTDTVFPNCLRLVMGQSRALTLPKLCIMVLDHMIQDHNFRGKSHRSNVSQPYRLTKSLENLRPGLFAIVFGETSRDNDRALTFTGIHESLWFPLLFFPV